MGATSGDGTRCVRHWSGAVGSARRSRLEGDGQARRRGCIVLAANAEAGWRLARTLTRVRFQPYRDTGFPYHDDQWISSAATGFAVLALAPLVERGEPVVRARR